VNNYEKKKCRIAVSVLRADRENIVVMRFFCLEKLYKILVMCVEVGYVDIFF
jgi:hypothetical protein